MLVEDVALAYDPDFPSLKLLQGILLFTETFGGELPFLYFSGMYIWEATNKSSTSYKKWRST